MRNAYLSDIKKYLGWACCFNINNGVGEDNGANRLRRYYPLNSWLGSQGWWMIALEYACFAFVSVYWVKYVPVVSHIFIFVDVWNTRTTKVALKKFKYLKGKHCLHVDSNLWKCLKNISLIKRYTSFNKTKKIQGFLGTQIEPQLTIYISRCVSSIEELT